MNDTIVFEHEERGGDFLGHIDYPSDGTGPFAYLEAIYVYPGRRNEGSGKYLIQKFEDICIILGAKTIEGMFLPHLDCNPKTVERFYYRNGYEISDRQPDGHRYISKQLDIKRLPAGETIEKPTQIDIQVPQEISYSEV